MSRSDVGSTVSHAQYLVALIYYTGVFLYASIFTDTPGYSLCYFTTLLCMSVMISYFYTKNGRDTGHICFSFSFILLISLHTCYLGWDLHSLVLGTEAPGKNVGEPKSFCLFCFACTCIY